MLPQKTRAPRKVVASTDRCALHEISHERRIGCRELGRATRGPKGARLIRQLKRCVEQDHGTDRDAATLQPGCERHSDRAAVAPASHNANRRASQRWQRECGGCICDSIDRVQLHLNIGAETRILDGKDLVPMV